MKAFGLALLLGIPLQANGPLFMKLEDAKAAALATGKPILVWSNCDALGGRNKQSPIEKDLWGSPLLRKHLGEFHFVRCSDKKTALAVGSKTVLTAEAIYLDADGDEFHRDTVADPSEVAASIGKALGKYADKSVAWSDPDDKTFTSGPRCLLFYTATGKSATSDADSESVMKALEDRSLVKFHARYVFSKVEFSKDSAEARKWGVSGAPTLLIVDPVQDAGPGAVTERLFGKRSTSQLRASLAKGLRAADKGRTSSR